MKGRKFLKGEILQEPGDNATTLFFLQDGVIEIFTRTENNHEFVLEKLFRGSIINYRTFFMEEDGKVFYRFGRNSIAFELPYETMMEIVPRHKELKKKFTSFKKQILLQNKPFPLDYIMAIPKHLQDKNKNYQHTV